MSDIMLYGVIRIPYELAMESEISRIQFYGRAQEAANRLETADKCLEELRQVVGDFIRAKGRYHTEQGYKSLVEAFDSTGPNVKSAMHGSAKSYMESDVVRRQQIDEAIKKADALISLKRDSRDRRKVDIPYQASGLPDRRQQDRRNKPRDWHD